MGTKEPTPPPLSLSSVTSSGVRPASPAPPDSSLCVQLLLAEIAAKDARIAVLEAKVEELLAVLLKATQ